MGRRVLIVNGGYLTDGFLTEMYRELNPERVIAVDGALSCLWRTGIAPTHLVGDFDTVDDGLLDLYIKEGYPVERHKPEKDETDAELAMELALRLSPERIDILGATGYRMDHALANVQLLYRPFCAGIPCRLLDECSEISLLTGEGSIQADSRWKYLSFLPFTDRVKDITLEGFRYPLKGHTMERGRMPGLGVSNELLSDQGHVSVGEGILLCIRSRDLR